jgi:hypothetical protein
MNANKFLITIAFFIAIQSSNAQSTITLNWKTPKKIWLNGQESISLSFDKAYYIAQLNGMPAVLLEHSLSSTTLSNEKYLALSKEELALLDTNLIEYMPKIHTIDGMLYKKKTFVHYVLPFRKNKSSQSYEKLISFSYKASDLSPLKRETASSISASNYASNSVLAQGDWYKLTINSSAAGSGDGIYKLDYNFLKNIGFPVSSIDPRKIKIFGNGMGMLPEANSVARPDDLLENNIWVVGQEDGKFDNGDYILFFAKGPHNIEFNGVLDEYDYEKNFYSDESYYFLTYSNSLGKRVISSDLITPSEYKTDIAKGIAFYETDDFNLVKSGRVWYSNAIDSPLRFNLNLDGIGPNSMATIDMRLMAVAKTFTNFSFNIAGQSFETSNVLPYDFNNSYGDRGKNLLETRTIQLSSPSVGFSISYNKKGDSQAKGYLNHVVAQYSKSIGNAGNMEQYAIKPHSEFTTQTILASGSAQNSIVWNVTKAHLAKAMPTLANSSGFEYTDSIATAQCYVLFRGNNFPNPGFAGKVANQNLHAIGNGTMPKLVIIAPPEFEPYAQKLANHRLKHSNISSVIVSPEKIYNEFSSGKQDLAAIRDFLRMLYKKGSGNDTLTNVLLMGAASYDYKNRVPENHNVIPIFESRESLDNVDSYSSDDFIALLDDNEGDWEANIGRVLSLDIGVGRLPAKTKEDAEIMVDKIIRYETNPASFGKWRNIANFTADDTSPSEPINSHALNSEIASEELERLNKIINVRKLFVDAFTQVPSPGGEISPSLNNAMLNNINSGNLIINYSGHGSEFQLAQEKFIDIADLNGLKNINRLPFYIAATCEFGRYDDPEKYSGSKSLMLNPNGGGIGLLCSTRPVYASSNTAMNVAFYRALFGSERKPSQLTLGEAMMRAKNNRIAQSGINNRNYALLCDPSMNLGFANNEIKITHINQKAFDPLKVDTLKALSSFEIKGEIVQNGALLSNFKGTIYLSLFDKEITLNTIGAAPNTVMSYKLRNSLVYDGSVSVDSGKFVFKFVVPKDINYELGDAKCSFYAFTNEQNPMDAADANFNIPIGSSATNIVADNKAPNIRLFMDDTTFQNGGLTNTNTLLIAKLFDDNGINISNAGIGHNISAQLSGSNEVLNLNEFYTTENNSYQYGVVKYPFNKLKSGNYTLRFTAWDTHNNASNETIEFVVGESEKLILSNVMNIPNPASDKTIFFFDHNRTGDDLLVEIEITDQFGKIVKTLNKNIAPAPTTINNLEWNTDDDLGTPLASGCYIYHLKVSSISDKAKAYKIQRLVILK